MLEVGTAALAVDIRGATRVLVTPAVDCRMLVKLVTAAFAVDDHEAPGTVLLVTAADDCCHA